MPELAIMRLEKETWRDVVIRYARPQGLERECLEAFDDERRQYPDRDEAKIAWDALYDWDCVPFVP